jgi:hypothetical protein
MKGDFGIEIIVYRGYNVKLIVHRRNSNCVVVHRGKNLNLNFTCICTFAYIIVECRDLGL